MADPLEPHGFWSYSRDDDKHSSGRLSQLRIRLQTELANLFPSRSKPLIFQDMASIGYGETWKSELQAALSECSFFVPIVTPAFLISEWCSLEVLCFRDRQEKLGRSDLIFPIHYINVDDRDPDDRKEVRDRAVWDVLLEHQWFDLRAYRLIPPETSIEVGQALEKLASDIRAALRVPTSARKDSTSVGIRSATLDALARDNLTRATTITGFAEVELPIRAVGSAPVEGKSQPQAPRRQPIPRERAEPLVRVAPSEPMPGYSLVTWLGPSSKVNAVAISPNGRLIATGHDNGWVVLWDVAGGHQVRRLEGHTDKVSSVAFTLKGRNLVSGSHDGSARLWDVDDGQTLRMFEGGLGVASVAIAPDGGRFATSCWDHTLRLWEIANGREVRRFEGHTAPVHAVAFAPNGRTLGSGSRDNTARLWDVATGCELLRPRSHGGWVNAVAFAPDGHTFATVANDGTAQVWDVTTRRELLRLQFYDEVKGVAFAPDGSCLATCSWEAVHLWELSKRLWGRLSGRELKRFAERRGVNLVAFTADARALTTGASDCTASFWGVASGNELRRFVGHASGVTSVAFSSDGNNLGSSSHNGIVWLWDPKSGRQIQCLQERGYAPIAFAPDCHSLAAGLSLYDVTTGRVLLRFGDGWSDANAAAFAPDGRTVISGGSRDGTVRLWEVASGREVRRLVVHGGGVEQKSPRLEVCVNAVAFAPDGYTFATASTNDDDTARIWDVLSDREMRCFHGHSGVVNSVAFAPNGCTIATGSDDQTARICEIGSARVMRQFVGHSAPINSVAFAPDGRAFATSGSYDRTVRLWDVTSGRELRRFEGHSYTVTSVAFAPDGHTLASASEDGTIRLWYVPSGRELVRMFNLTNEAQLIVYGDGRSNWGSKDIRPFLSLIRGDERAPVTAAYNARYFGPHTPDEVRQLLGVHDG